MHAIIFDMDGLMIDSERLYFETERELAKEYDKTVEERTLWNMMGRSPLEAMTVFIKDLDLPITPQDLLIKRDKIMKYKYENDLTTMKGLFEIIDGFYNKLKLAIATGAPKIFMNIVVDQLNIRNKFDILQTSDEITNGKPDPEIYLKTAEKLGLSPKDCFVLEDSSNGAMAGKKAGCYSIAIESEYNKEQDFSFVDFYAKDLLEARNHINGLIVNGE